MVSHTNRSRRIDVVVAVPRGITSGRAMPNDRKDDDDHDGLGAASWFVLGLLLIAAVAGIIALF